MKISASSMKWMGFLLFMGSPFSGPLAVGVLLGIKLLLAGSTMLTLGSVAWAGGFLGPVGQRQKHSADDEGWEGVGEHR